jgi:hypothetical protein
MKEPLYEIIPPRVGSLWIWRGNNYDVTDYMPYATPPFITLREHGSDTLLNQCLWTGKLSVLEPTSA